MLPDLSTYAHAADLDRALALRRAERRARLLDAVQQRAAPGNPPGAQARRAPRSPRRSPVRRLVLACGLVLGLAVPAVAVAHPHTVVTPNHTQVIANGQDHGPFVNGVSCGGDPAAYGLETAHHGPDAGIPGKADGCYQTTGNVPPGQDVENPVIR